MVYSQVMNISFFDKIMPDSSRSFCETTLDMGDCDFFFVTTAGVMWMPVYFDFSRF